MKPRVTDRPSVVRSFDLDDVVVRVDQGGRTLTAYAAVFGVEQEIRDFEGHYIEKINGAGFDRAISHGIQRFRFIYNHGMTLHGTPSERFSVPIGTPLEVRPDARGLLTVTRIAETELGDEVLEVIRSGGLRGMSFSGPIVRSREVGKRGALRVVERMELGLREYGPTPFPAYAAAEVVGVRSQAILEQLRDLDDEERAELLAQFSDTPGPIGGPDPSVDPDTQQEPAPGAPPAGPSLEALELAQGQRRRRT